MPNQAIRDLVANQSDRAEQAQGATYVTDLQHYTMIRWLQRDLNHGHLLTL